MIPAVVLACSLVASADGPSVAVMSLANKQGVSADSAELLTQNLVAALRKTGVFNKIVTAADIQATLNFDTQKQLMSCESASCMAEIAGSLGVDFIIVGSLGKLGEVYLFNVNLVNAKSGIAASSVSRSVGGSESGLLTAVESVIQELLAGWKGTDRPTLPAQMPRAPTTKKTAPPVEPKTPEAVAPTPAPTPTTKESGTSPTNESGASPTSEKKKGPPIIKIALLGAGGAVIGLALPLLLVAVGGGATSLGIFVAYPRVAGLDVYQMPLQVMIFVGIAAIGVGVVSALLAALVGGGVMSGAIFAP